MEKNYSLAKIITLDYNEANVKKSFTSFTGADISGARLPGHPYHSV